MLTPPSPFLQLIQYTTQSTSPPHCCGRRVGHPTCCTSQSKRGKVVSPWKLLWIGNKPSSTENSTLSKQIPFITSIFLHACKIHSSHLAKSSIARSMISLTGLWTELWAVLFSLLFRGGGSHNHGKCLPYKYVHHGKNVLGHDTSTSRHLLLTEHSMPFYWLSGPKVPWSVTHPIWDACGPHTRSTAALVNEICPLHQKPSVWSQWC